MGRCQGFYCGAEVERLLVDQLSDSRLTEGESP
jgi:hypothetical protein